VKQTLGPHASRTRSVQAPMKTGDSTVAQVDSRSRKKRVAPWVIGAAALVLIGILFAGFYAYQRGNNSGDEQGNPIVAEPAATSTTMPQPLADSLKEEHKPDVSSQRVEAADPANKNDKTTKTHEKIGAKIANAPTVSVPAPPRGIERSPFPQNTPAVPSLPQINEPDRRLGRGRGRMGGVAIRNFPDGSQLITSPDGTRVLVLPDGSRRVFRPGERMDRRKRFR
jgi:hypothetical protein